MSKAKMKIPSYLKRPGAIIALTWFLFIVIGSLTSPLWVPFDPYLPSTGSELQTPSLTHLLGTDDLGRDIFSRIMIAGAGTIIGSAITVLIAFGVGLPSAFIAAQAGGKVEQFFSRFAEIIFALPAMVMILALVAAIGESNMQPLMVFFGFLISPAVYRVMLGQVISIRQRLYVDAARLNGMSSARINLRHILPGIWRTVLVQAALIFVAGIGIQAGLSFLGVGPQEPNPSWGAMILQATNLIYFSPWLMVPPGLILVATVFAINELADIFGEGEAQASGVKQFSFKDLKGSKRSNLEQVSEAPKTEKILELRDLVVGVEGKHELVSGVSLGLNFGQVLGVVGESGCGKTMTALSVIGLLPPGVAIRSGSILLNGVDIADWNEQELNTIRGHQIAYISQEPMVALDPMFTVAHQLNYPLRRLRGFSKSQAKAESISLLKKVGILYPERVMKSYPHQLSGGMAQRVAIALALTGQPKLLIADEPTTALDVTIQAEILDLLRSLVKELDMAMIIVTHNLGVVADIADEVAVMYAGQVIESGPVSDVLLKPAHPYTAALLGADPHFGADKKMPERLASIPGTVPPAWEWTNSCRFAARCDFATEVCKQPLRSAEAHGTGSVQCLRNGELKLTIATGSKN
jgi:peptide/nickel transport system permease protein